MTIKSYRSWPRTGAGVYALFILSFLAFTACRKNDKEPTQQVSLTLTTYSPAEGAPGTTVVIKGTAFAQEKLSNTVYFNGIVAEVHSVSATGTELSVAVPEEATTGPITVKVGDKTVSSSTGFTVNQLAPLISNISPLKGDIGTEVTITGQRLKGECKVYFGGVIAQTVNRQDDKKLVVKVPEGAINGKLKVISNSFEVLGADLFWVKPRINQLSHNKGEEREIVTISGANFSEVKEENKVFFGTVQATEITEATATSLKVKVPANGYGPISVSVADQKTETTQSFKLLPTILTHTSKGERRSTIILTGTSILPDAKIYLGTDEITHFEPGRSTTSLVFKVPPESVGGIIWIHQLDEIILVGEFKVTNIWAPIYTGKGITDYHGNISFVYNNKIYLGFGYGKENSNEIQNDKFAIFDPQKVQWYTGPTVPSNVPLRENATSTFQNGKLYVAGGYNWQGNVGTALTDFWEYTLVTRTWRKTKATVPDRVTGLGIHKNSGGIEDIYLFNENKISIYNSSNESFIDKGIVAAGIDTKHAGIETIGDNIYLFAGSKGAGIDNKLLKYDVLANSMSALSSCPENTEIFYQGTFTVNNRLYAVVRSASSGQEYRTYQYDALNNSWTNLNILLTSSLNGINTIEVINNKAYACTYDGKVFEFTPN